MKAFGRYAREKIRRIGKSQKALARELGVSPAYISQILTGKKNPPDLGRLKNRAHLKAWADSLGASEEELLDRVRYELHRVPPRPEPRFAQLREVLLRNVDPEQKRLVEDIRALELHPAESLMIKRMVQIFVVLQEDWSERKGHAPARFQEFCSRASSDRQFVEGELLGFFRMRPFSWNWDPEANEVMVSSRSAEIPEAIERVGQLLSDVPPYQPMIPVIGHVSAGEGFEYTDGGYCAGEGFEQVPLPPGMDPRLARVIYCVRVRGDSLKEFFNDGTLLFIKPQSWEEIKDGDLVVFKDRRSNKALVKKVEFSGENLILKPMNHFYKNMVLHRADLTLLERVTAIVF